MANGPKTAKELIKAGGVVLPKLAKGVKLILESICGSMYEVTVVDPVIGLVEFYSSHPAIKDNNIRQAIFSGSWSDLKGTIQIPDWIVKDCRMVLKFREINFVTEPIAFGTVYGDGWKYEAIS